MLQNKGKAKLKLWKALDYSSLISLIEKKYAEVSYA